MNDTDTPDHFVPQSASPKSPATARQSGVIGQQDLSPLEKDFSPMESTQFVSVFDALLKRPGRVIHALIHGKDAQTPLYLLAILLTCLAATGLIMGGFSGGAQFWAVPLKVILGTLASGLICLPSLYILLCLCGGTQNFLQTVRMLLLGLTLSGILLLGFIPVAWIFSQSTESFQFMGLLYLSIWAIGLFFGLRLMHRAFQFLNNKKMGALLLWIFIFILVLLQMSTTLRPLIGPYEPLHVEDKMFFLEHWTSP